MSVLPNLDLPLKSCQLNWKSSVGEQVDSPLLIAACKSGVSLAEKVACKIATKSKSFDPNRPVELLRGIDFNFSDGETCVRLPIEVQDREVFVIQCVYDPTSPRTIDQNYMAFLITVRTLKEWGARRIVGVLPYLAYARQNKPTPHQREPVTVRLMADLSAEAGLDGLITFHPHTDQINGFYRGVRVERLDPLEVFKEAFTRFAGREDVILISPDSGASRYVSEMGRVLNFNCALTTKFRPRPEVAEILDLVGNFQGKCVAIILDDMISSGGTVAQLIEKIQSEKMIKEIYLGISHNLCLENAKKRLVDLYQSGSLQGFITTNSIPQTSSYLGLPFLSCLDLSDLLSSAVMDFSEHKLS